MALVADHHDRVALSGKAARLDVDLGDQRTGGVDRAQVTGGGVLVDGGGDAVGGEDDDLARGHVGLLLDEDRAALGQLLDHVLVVNDLLAHVDGRPVEVEGTLDGLHGAVDPGAVAAGRGEQYPAGAGGRERDHQRKGSGGVSAAPRRGWPRSRREASLAEMDTDGNHLDRLTAIDASFLSNESSTSHMHVGAILIFEGPPPRYVDLLEHIRGRLDQVPRFRQRLVVPPLEAGRPLWADDVNFNLSYHIRHTALPQPGGEEQLKRLAGRVFSQQLDRSKPLWELWLAQGLERDRFAILTKTHHAMVDGISGVDIGTVLFDLEPVPRAKPPVEDWVPHPPPRTVDLLARGAIDVAMAPLRLTQRALGALGHPGSAARRLSEALEGVGAVVGAFADPAPDVPLNQPIGPHRRFVWVRSELATFKGIKDALGGTVNDVVLATVTGALRDWLQGRGVRTEGLELRALVPVSIRSEDERGNLGNRIAAMRGPLPVYVEDPVRRLRIVSEQMEHLKRSKQALGAEVISRFNDFAPPTLLAQASRINFSTRLFNLIVTNVPGPQIPLYVLGRQLEEVFPVAFLPQNHALAVAIMSYNGRIGFGLLADYESIADLDRIASAISRSLDELAAAAA